MFKKSKVVMLATQKATKIYKEHWEHGEIFFNPSYKGDCIPQHLYFLSDDEIKEGDWIYENWLKQVRRANNLVSIVKKRSKKIIASTDESLGLPRPSDKFIQKYCELGGIEYVMVEYELYRNYPYGENNKSLDPKVAPDNTITIKSVKDSWNRKEMIEFAKKAYDKGYENGYDDLHYESGKYRNKWIEKNL